MSKVCIGLIGGGWIGSEHARNLAANPHCELVAISDVDETKGEALRANCAPAARFVKDYTRLLEADDIDAVYICSPNALHAEMSIAAARAGKHIMCEKPMAITLEDCRRVRDAVRESGVKYLIGYHRRLNPLFQHVKGMLDSGALGRPVYVESDYLHHIPGDWAIWDWLGKEAVAGSLFHAGCGHNIDLVRYLCGEIVEVNCVKDILLPRKIQVETEDVAVAVLRFANGAVGKVTLLLGGIIPFRFRFNLYGTKGSVENNKIWLESMPRFDQTGYEANSINLPEIWIPDNVQGGIAETWGRLDDHFVDVVAGRAESLNDIESAWRTSRTVFAILESANQKRTIALDQDQ